MQSSRPERRSQRGFSASAGEKVIWEASRACPKQQRQKRVLDKSELL